MKRILIYGALALALVSCVKENVIDSEDGNTMIAVIEGSETKTSFIDITANPVKLQWEGDEDFAAWDGTSLLKYSRVSGDIFQTDGSLSDGADCYGYYPYSAVKSAGTDGFEVEFPTEQSSVKDNIQDNMLPMAGKWVDGRMCFKNIGAMLAFSLLADDTQNGLALKSVTLTADKPIAGTAKVPYGSTAIDISGGVNSITLDCEGVILSSANATSFYMTVAPGNYSKLDVEFRTSDNNIAEYTIEGDFNFQRSCIYSTALDTKVFAYDKELELQAILDKQIADGCSPYVASVIDVDYVPGQFINTMPSGMTSKSEAIAQTAALLAGQPSGNGMVHLGGWGGSVTVGFDHPVLNMDGADFRGYGNGFGGSSEPGIYYVAQKDENGQPGKWYLIKHAMYDYAIHDYQITYYRPAAETVTTYTALYWKGDYATTITNVTKANFSKLIEIPSLDPNESLWYYYNKAIYKDSGTGTAAIKKLYKANMVSVNVSSPDAPATYSDEAGTCPLAYVYSTTSSVIDQYIYWEDNMGHNGFECKNSYHNQSYWPEYAGETITVSGEYLPTNSFDESGNGTYYVQDAKYWGFPTVGIDESYTDPLDAGKELGMGAYGFCDNYPNAHSLSCIDIDWAVDENGQPANLDHIDFVKVQSATHKQSGWLGEISTEFCGIDDLHILGEKVFPYTGIKPDINNIPKSGDPDQPESGLLYWTYKPVNVMTGKLE